MTSQSTLRLWFRPGLMGLHLLLLVALAFCVVMGLWQMGVYDSRQAHEQADKQEVPRVAFTELWGPDEPFEARLNHRPVRVEGTFAPAAEQVWVTGKKQGGSVGAWLLAPLQVTGENAALLVVRGWSASTGEFPAVPEGPVRIDAVLEQGEGGGSAFDVQRREIDSIRTPALTNELPYDLYSGFAISESSAVSGGLELADPPKPDVSKWVGSRNFAYAVQWWVFGAFAIFMWWRMATESVATRRDDDD